MTELKWYFTSLLVASRAAGKEHLARWYHCLLTAIGHDDAYAKATKLGHQWEDTENEYKGVGQLLLVHETPTDGAEILWSEEEMRSEEVEGLWHDARANGNVSTPSQSGWYLGRIVLAEVHDEGSHGGNILIWINSYLIKAPTSEEAYEKAWQLGVEHQDEPGSHLCDGQKAHWEFKGIQAVIPLLAEPVDGAVLWSEDLSATTSELERLIPNKSLLGVFEWEGNNSSIEREISGRLEN